MYGPSLFWTLWLTMMAVANETGLRQSGRLVELPHPSLLHRAASAHTRALSPPYHPELHPWMRIVTQGSDLAYWEGHWHNRLVLQRLR